MKRLLSLFITISTFLSATTVESGWNLLGTPEEINLEDKFSQYSDVSLIWTYEDGTWKAFGNSESMKTNIQNSGLTETSSVSANSGFWVINLGDSFDISLPTGGDINFTLESGWNLAGSGVSRNLHSLQNYSDVPLIWIYKNGAWRVFGNRDDYRQQISWSGLLETDTISENDGFWILNKGEAVSIFQDSDANSTIFGTVVLPDGFGDLEKVQISLESSTGSEILSENLEDRNFTFEIEPCENCVLRISGENYAGTEVVETEVEVSSFSDVEIEIPMPPTPLDLSSLDNGRPDILHSYLETDSDRVSLNLRVADPEGDAVSCEVEWGDGEISEIENCYSEEISHTYSENGKFALIVRVSDEKHSFGVGKIVDISGVVSLERTLSRELSVSESNAPKIFFLRDSLDHSDFSLSFLAYDLDGDDISCELEIKNEYFQYFPNCGDQSVDLIFDTAGEKNITLRVSDGNFTDEYSYKVYVSSLWGEEPTFNSVELVPASNRILKVLGKLSEEVVTLSIDWGDGTPVESFEEFDSFNLNMSHLYEIDGNYTVGITVFDEANMSSEGSHEIEISQSYAPEVEISNFQISNGGELSFDYEVFDRDGDEVLGATLFWGDGNSVEISGKGSLEYTYTSVPTENIRIETSDDSKDGNITFRKEMKPAPKSNISESTFRETIELFGTVEKMSEDFDINISWGDGNWSNYEVYRDFILKSEGWEKINLRLTDDGWSSDELNLSIARSSLSSAPFGDKIYIFGGYTGNSGNPFSSAVEEFRDETLSLSSKRDMNEEMAYLSATNWDEKIYILGGYGGQWNRELNAYTPKEDSWETISNIPTTRLFLGLTSYDWKLYTIGGFGVSKNEVEIYDINSSTWSTGTSMPTPRGGLSVVTVGEKIYAIGGEAEDNTSLSTVEIYDIESDSWSSANSLQTPRAYHTSFYFYNKIYVVGGIGSGNEYLNSVEILDLDSGTWSYGESLDSPRAYATGSLVSKKEGRVGNYYLFGGKKSDTDRVPAVELYSPDYSFIEDNNTNLNWEDGNLSVYFSHTYESEGNYTIRAKFIDRNFMIRRVDFPIVVDTSSKPNFSNLEIERNNSLEKITLLGSLSFIDTNITTAVVDWGSSTISLSEFEDINLSKLLPTGENEVNITITDHYGNSFSKTLQIWVEDDQPEIVSLPNLVSKELNATFEIEVSDASSEVYAFAIGDNEEGENLIWHFVEPEDGNISIWVETNSTEDTYLFVKDLAENISEATLLEVYADTEIPDIFITFPDFRVADESGIVAFELDGNRTTVENNDSAYRKPLDRNETIYGTFENGILQIGDDINLSINMEENKTLKIEFFDFAGNSVSYYYFTDENGVLTQDKTKPELLAVSKDFVSVSDNLAGVGKIIIGDDEVSVERTVSGNISIPYDFGEDGEKNLVVQVEDLAENSSDSLDLNFTLDTTPPTALFTPFLSNMKLKIEASDENGLKSYYFGTEENQSKRTYISNSEEIVFKDFNFTYGEIYYGEVVDNYGNYFEIEMDSTDTKYFLDTTPPVFEELILPTETNLSKIELEIVSSDNFLGITSYAITKSSDFPEKWSVEDGNLIRTLRTEDTNQTFWIWLRDRGGNIHFVERRVVFDTEEPFATFETNLTDGSVKILATDNHLLDSYYIGIEGEDRNFTKFDGNFSEINLTIPFSFREENSYIGVVKDRVGYEYEVEITDFVDEVAPELEVIYDDVSQDGNIEITISISDNFSSASEYKIDDGSWTDWGNEENVTVTYQITVDGSEFYTIEIFAKDLAGNIGEKNITSYIDTTIPTISWRRGEDMPQAMKNVGVVERNGSIYLIGGEDNSNIYNTNYRYSPETDSWETLEEMPTTRRSVGVTERDGTIFAVGGYDDLYHLEVVETFSNSWSSEDDLITHRTPNSVLEIDGSIFVIGGENSDANLSSIEKFINSWETLSLETDAGVVLEWNSSFLAFQNGDIEKNSSNSSWSIVGTYSTEPEKGLRIGSSIYLFGSEMEENSSGSWKEFPNLDSSEFGVSSYEDTIYLFGGDRNGTILNETQILQTAVFTPNWDTNSVRIVSEDEYALGKFWFGKEGDAVEYNTSIFGEQRVEIEIDYPLESDETYIGTIVDKAGNERNESF